LFYLVNEFDKTNIVLAINLNGVQTRQFKGLIAANGEPVGIKGIERLIKHSLQRMMITIIVFVGRSSVCFSCATDERSEHKYMFFLC
jgi:hypothetical protein